jgi:hypothetical protein
MNIHKIIMRNYARSLLVVVVSHLFALTALNKSKIIKTPEDQQRWEKTEKTLPMEVSGKENKTHFCGI